MQKLNFKFQQQITMPSGLITYELCNYLTKTYIYGHPFIKLEFITLTKAPASAAETR